MTITMKKLNTTDCSSYDVHSNGVNIGQVWGNPGQWVSHPAVNGELRPWSSALQHKTRKAAIARLVRHMHDADE